jgi:hypothetical protein
MPALMPPQTVLTPADAGNQLQTEGLDALGLVVPNLSSGWADADPVAADVDDAQLQLTLTSPRAPFRGVLEIQSTPAAYADVNGAPITSAAAVLKLHPEGARRLAGLVAARLGAPLQRPVPTAMLVHGVTVPASPQPMDWFLAGEALGFAGPHAVSFHDSRGLPIDPIAVAAIFADLIGFRPALNFGHASMPAVGAAGGLNGITARATTPVRVHVIDPHGHAYAATRDAARLKLVDAGGIEQSVIASHLIALASGQRIGRASADDTADAASTDASVRAQPLRWGWAMNDTLDRTARAVPTLPAGVALATQFLRVMAVDLDWHLLGNRGDALLNNVPGDDGAVPDFALPRVRPAVPGFDYLVDGSDVLGAASQIAAGFPPAGADVLALLASPAIDPATPLPPGPGAAGHWPAFPGPNPGGGLPSGTDATQGLAAAFRAPGDGTDARLDVIVTVAADVVPAGTHVRVYPRRFVEIDAISGDQPSFVRGDGAAGIAQAGQATPLLMVNPFGLASGAPLPSPAVLAVDVVITARNGQRRMHSAVDLTVSTTTQTFAGTLAPFGGTALLATPAMQALTTAFGATSVAPASVFALPPPSTPPASNPGSVIELVRTLANESVAPRQGPRLPTQGRFDTVFALGAAPAAGQPLAWQAVLSGARWTLETRSSQPELGDPGNPAGPDVHAAGVRVSGQLAYDLALHAIKRAQPMVPMGAGAPGWIVMTGGDNWNDPAPDAGGTIAGAMLETIAPFCDSPELSFLPVPQPGDSVQGAVDALANRLGVPSPGITVGNEQRLLREVQREIVTAKSGQRDALWSLRRAIRQAREFVYIEGPAFGRTARPAGAPLAHEVDLVELLRAGLQANPRLKVAICIPRMPDFAEAKANWVRAALAQRKQAIETLTTQDRQRVAAFHPIGFPGRASLIRSTVVIVDDVYALVGTSHVRRRGMTFDGGCDVASIDRALNAQGRSAAIARFRQELMAAKLGIAVPSGPANSSALWTRLSEPDSAFDVLADLLAAGGQGRCSPVFAGPTDNRVIPQTDQVADPDGVDPDGGGLLSLFKTLLIEA